MSSKANLPQSDTGTRHSRVLGLERGEGRVKEEHLIAIKDIAQESEYGRGENHFS